MHMKWIARAKTAGARLVVFPELSLTGYYLKDLAAAESCRLMDRFYASYLTVYVVYVNRVGHEDGIAFWGGSEIVAPDGTVAARAPEFDEDLLIGEIDPELVARERARNPLLRDEREDIVLRNIAGRLGLPFDRRD